jgi:hypothetical protein
VNSGAEEPAERVIRRLLGPWRAWSKKDRVGVWTSRDGGTLMLASAYESTHRTKRGVLYNKFVRLRDRLGTWQRRAYNECGR